MVCKQISHLKAEWRQCFVSILSHIHLICRYLKSSSRLTAGQLLPDASWWIPAHHPPVPCHPPVHPGRFWAELLRGLPRQDPCSPGFPGWSRALGLAAQTRTAGAWLGCNGQLGRAGPWAALWDTMASGTGCIVARGVFSLNKICENKSLLGCWFHDNSSQHRP